MSDTKFTQDPEMNLTQLLQSTQSATQPTVEAVEPERAKPSIPQEKEEIDDNEAGHIFIDTTPKKEPQMPQPTGVMPETMSAFEETLKEMELEIEEKKEIAEKIQEEKAAKKEEEEETDPEEDFEAKYNEAVVVIDKAGMGHVINFTEEERAKLEKVRKIKLEEVETVSIKSVKKKKAKKNSLDKILKRKTSLHTTPIVAPASGYTATMKGCSSYELVSLMSGSENALLENEQKWSLIYDKLADSSIKFANFNDFLKETAAIDYDSFIYGILCSTYPDDDKIPLKCQNKKCGQEFDHHYSVHSLIRAEKMGERLKENVIKTVDGSHTELSAKQVHADAPVSQIKSIVLPVSGYIANVYLQSAYDLLYKSIKSVTENEEEKYNQAAILSTIVESILIPDEDEDGAYLEYDETMDITKIIYSLTDTDVLSLSKQSEVLMDDIGFEFGLMNVKCPHCSEFSESIPFEIESILFYRYQQAMTTSVE